MKKKFYISTWLSNTSVAAIIVGGFQQISLGLRLLALTVAIVAFAIGLKLAKED